MTAKKVFRKISEINKQFCYFGFSYGMLYFLSIFLKKLKPTLRKKAIHVLDKKIGYVFERKTWTYFPKETQKFEKNIFFFWAQGKEYLPEIPKYSFSSIKRLYPDYNIIFIDLENFSQYIELPESIVEKFKAQKISIQTFSDILRLNLLFKYGGVWCDATVIMFDTFPFEEYVEKYGFWSINNNTKEKNNIWGKVFPVTFTTFIMATYKENHTVEACVELYNEYYSKYDCCIDYFMTDYFLIMTMERHFDDNMLFKIPNPGNDPFYVARCIRQEKAISLDETKKCPQKFNWRESNPEYYKKIEELLV